MSSSNVAPRTAPGNLVGGRLAGARRWAGLSGFGRCFLRALHPYLRLIGTDPFTCATLVSTELRGAPALTLKVGFRVTGALSLNATFDHVILFPSKVPWGDAAPALTNSRRWGTLSTTSPFWPGWPGGAP